jgi:hypothetical protein
MRVLRLLGGERRPDRIVERIHALECTAVAKPSVWGRRVTQNMLAAIVILQNLDLGVRMSGRGRDVDANKNRMDRYNMESCTWVHEN